MNCSSCQEEILKSWKFCPACGVRLLEHSELREEVSVTQSRLPERLADLISDYQSLTGSKLNNSILEDFLKSPAVRTLSVIERDRRVRSGKKVRRNLGNGMFSLDLQMWLDHIYDNPLNSEVTRVWMTSKGDKYHLERECRGLKDGQNYARFFGKDTYNPQFVEIRYAAHVLGKTPCLVCNPPKFIK